MLHELVHAALLCRFHWLQPVLMHYLVYGTWQQLGVIYMLFRRNCEM